MARRGGKAGVRTEYRTFSGDGFKTPTALLRAYHIATEEIALCYRFSIFSRILFRTFFSILDT